MMEIAEKLGDWLIWIGSVGAAVIAMWRWVARPLKEIRKSTDMLMGDRLSQGHDYWMRKQYCPPLDRARLCDMHKEYAKRGLNHLMDSYEEDLLELPDKPPAKGA